jgi:hypothetical protein
MRVAETEFIFGHKEKCEKDKICEMGGSSYNSSRKKVS